MTSVSPISAYESAKRDSDLIVLVFYRGKWCPLCVEWLKGWTTIPNLDQQLKDRNGTILVICSEPQELVDSVIEASGLKGISSVKGIGDPDNTIVQAVKRAGTLAVTVTGEPGPYETRGQSYPKGMVQSAVLITKKDGTVVYAWAAVPKMRNLMGATNRPPAPDIWSYAVEWMASPDASWMKTPRGKSLRYLLPHFKNLALGRWAKDGKPTKKPSK